MTSEGLGEMFEGDYANSASVEGGGWFIQFIVFKSLIIDICVSMKCNPKQIIYYIKY